MAELKTYDSKQFGVLLDGFEITGLAEGDFLTITPNADLFALYVGADGEPARSKINNYSAKINLTLSQTSNGNDILSGFVAADRVANGGKFILTLIDKSGRSVFNALSCWVSRMPDISFGNEIGEREWVLETGQLEFFIAGN